MLHRSGLHALLTNISTRQAQPRRLSYVSVSLLSQNKSMHRIALLLKAMIPLDTVEILGEMESHNIEDDHKKKNLAKKTSQDI